jgi:hypothetical protein
VLSDPNQSDEFKSSKHWDSPLLDHRLKVPESTPGGDQVFKSNSFSGNERNRLVMRSGNGFKDRSLVSGIDCREDARSFAILDFDGDGWLDIALASIYKPRMRLFRNRFGDLGAKGRAVEVVLRGSSTSATAVSGMSNRDAIGATLTAVTDRGKRAYRKSIGEGLAAQNSGRIRVTLAKGEKLLNLSVRWPSGNLTQISPIPEKSFIEIEE